MKEIIIALMPTGIKDVITFFFYKFSYKGNVNIKLGARVSNVWFEGKNVLRRGVVFRNSELGFGSYISEFSHLNKIKIGRFCCIGTNVKNHFGQHPSSNFVSIHPAFYSTASQAGFTFTDKQKFEEHKYVDNDKKFVNIIGNDVWIGSNVIIMEGISIGSGAIVASGAIVTKDVKPYEIVGGVPAKHIKFRFNDDTIKKLLDFSWWNKPINWLKQNFEQFDDIEKFLMRINEEKR